MQWTQARRAQKMNPSVLREILKVTERPGIISLAGGLPSADTFPVDAVRDATARVLRTAPREALQYAASEGYAPLRALVAQQLQDQSRAAGQPWDVDPAQVMSMTSKPAPTHNAYLAPPDNQAMTVLAKALAAKMPTTPQRTTSG